MNEKYPLPEGWRWGRLGEVCEKPVYGYTASAEHKEVGPKFLRITDIQNGKVDWDRVPYCRYNKALEKYLLKSGDVLFARTGATTGKSYLITAAPPKTIFASYLIRVRTGNDLMSEFLYQFLQSDFYWQQVESNKRGGAQPNMNATLLSNIVLPLPPLPGQKRIVAKLQELMQEIERARTACEKQLEAAKALPAAYLREVFESEEAKKWERKRLGAVCQINPPRPKNFHRTPDSLTSFVPMVAVDEKTGTITKPEVVPYSKIAKGYTYFEENDILFAKITPCMQNGKHVIARNLINGIGYGTTEFHVLRPNNQVLSEWIWYFIRQPYFLKEATAYFTGAVGQQRVPDSFLSDYIILIPSIEVQKNIIEELKQKMAQVRNLQFAIQNQQSALNTLPQTILKKAFSGKL